MNEREAAEMVRAFVERHREIVPDAPALYPRHRMAARLEAAWLLFQK